MRKFTESLGRDIFEHEEELHDLLVEEYSVFLLKKHMNLWKFLEKFRIR